MHICMFVDVSIEILLFNRKKKKQNKNNSHGKFVKSILQVLHLFFFKNLDSFLMSLVFNMFSTLMLVEVNLSGI